MDCINPGAILPEDLLAYATGEGNSMTAEHVTACPACAEQADSYGAADHLLRTRLFRVDCPPAQTLGELAIGMLEPEASLTVRSHLALCPHCSDELALMTDALRNDPLEDLAPRPRRLSRIIARLLPATRPNTAPAGVRGANETTTLTYDASNLTISLAVTVESEQPVRRWALLGLVVNDAGDAPPAVAAARLLREGRVVSETSLDEWGNIAFSALEAGLYDLEVDTAAGVIVAEGIEVGPHSR